MYRYFSPCPLPRLSNYLPSSEVKARRKELEERQQQYLYESPRNIPRVAFLKGPVDRMPDEMPCRLWIWRTVLARLRVTLNFVSLRPYGVLTAIILFIKSLFVNNCREKSMEALEKSFEFHAPRKEISKKVCLELAGASMHHSQCEERNRIFAPYRAMWRLFSRPAIADVFLEDETFGRMRVAGFNPMSLYGVTDKKKLPFWIRDDVLPQPGDTLRSAIREKRLYAVDYSFLANVEQQKDSNKVVAITKGLFVVPHGGGLLQPIAINVNGDTVLPVTQQDLVDTRWEIAKLALTNNDAIHHELIAHLGKTHLLVEPFVAATMRQLPSAHPLHMLLRPHFEGTVFINDRASNNLVAPGGDVDRLFGGEISSLMELCADIVLNNNFNDSMPDVEMELRSVDHPILQMPYREDALDHFSALCEWTFDYLSVFYDDEDAIKNDQELQAWAAELVSAEGGRLQGFGDNGDGKVRTVRYLSRAAAMVIFTASVQHAAVNFAQFAYMAFAPASPGSLWAPPPTMQEAADVARWAKMLTPMETAVDQIQVLAVIGDVYHSKLGRYGWGELPRDKGVQQALGEYQRKLKRIERNIREREAGETLKYEFMRPSRVPQSINI